MSRGWRAGRAAEKEVGGGEVMGRSVKDWMEEMEIMR